MNRRNLFSMALASIALPFAAKAGPAPVATKDEEWERYYRAEPSIRVDGCIDGRTRLQIACNSRQGAI